MADRARFAASDLLVTPTGLRFLGRRFPCTIGRGGTARNKREGDGCTPLGTHRIVGCLYRPDRLPGGAVPGWALPIGLRDLWSDDPRDPDYNLMVEAPHSFRHETLRRADPMYDLILITDWNWPFAVPGRGSAIFLHSWRRPLAPTAGCIALSRKDLLWIANRITPRTRLVVHG
ncbi:MAG: L,D-transpeptidase family protein [Tabrizicola sp.]|nr:L,D-transpeptidase family protein [Tabrizicola sp.]